MSFSRKDGGDVPIDDVITSILASPASSEWLRQSLTQALTRDCVDAANDAELLSDLLIRKCSSITNSIALLD